MHTHTRTPNTLAQSHSIIHTVQLPLPGAEADSEGAGVGLGEALDPQCWSVPTAFHAPAVGASPVTARLLPLSRTPPLSRSLREAATNTGQHLWRRLGVKSGASERGCDGPVKTLCPPSGIGTALLTIVQQERDMGDTLPSHHHRAQAKPGSSELSLPETDAHGKFWRL
jgi:hypothetical protein